MNLTARADHIKARLCHHWITEVGAAASPPLLENWVLIVNELGPHARYGVGWPMPFDDPALVVPFCPELIDQVTSELSDEDLDEYLGVVEFLTDVVIVHLCDGVSREEAVERAENQLHEQGPGSMALFSDTQIAALDRGIGC